MGEVSSVERGLVIPSVDSRLGRIMAAFAAMLMTLLVVQAPIASVDRLLHAAGHSHAANAFAGMLIDLPDHDHQAANLIDAADDHDAGSAHLVADEAPSEQAAPGPHHHHHHDGPSVYGAAGGLDLPRARSSRAAPFRLEDDLRHGLEGPGRDRPPKALLAHVV